jgi:ectoine hydroxylase-related dioxygenase (phytanoyl-CoA dioxygenase family)
MPTMLMRDGVVLDSASLAAAYDRDGFVLVESLLDPRQIAEAQAGVAWAMANVAGNYRWIKQRTYEWLDAQPIFVELIEHPVVLELAERILGDDFHLIAAQCSRNTRDDFYAPGVTNIHQDGCFFPTAGRELPGVAPHHYGFSAMWYLQDTPLEMGPTETLRGKHLEGPFTNADVEERDIWRRPIPAGSLLVFAHRCWHRGALNQTDRPRDLITNAYARRAIDKVHLFSRQHDGQEAYATPRELLARLSPAMRDLLRE